VQQSQQPSAVSPSLQPRCSARQSGCIVRRFSPCCSRRVPVPSRYRSCRDSVPQPNGARGDRVDRHRRRRDRPCLAGGVGHRAHRSRGDRGIACCCRGSGDVARAEVARDRAWVQRVRTLSHERGWGLDLRVSLLALFTCAGSRPTSAPRS
jgi:hypothetical protein